MSNETAETKVIKNAQDGGKTVLLSKKSGEAIAEILDEFRRDWESLGSNGEKQKEFIKTEVYVWGRAHIRCGCLIHEIETKKIYKKFGHKTVAALFKEICNMKPPDVSKAKYAFVYAEPIAKALPDVKLEDLHEAQMRQLRATVKQLHSELKDEEKVKRAVELYTEIHSKNPSPTAKQIKSYGEKKLKEKQETEQEDKEAAVQSNQSGGETDGAGNDEDNQGSSSAHDPMPHKGTVLEDSDFDEPLDNKTRKIIDKEFAEELSSLLGFILGEALLDKETQDRINAALRRLGNESPDHAEGEEGDGEH